MTFFQCGPCPKTKSATSLISPIHSTPRSDSHTKCHRKKLFSQILKFSRGHVSLSTKLDVGTHYNPTETFQYTRFSSSHPLSVRKGFIKGETLRLLRTNSVKETFELRKLEFLTRLLERGYPRELAENILAEVKFSSRNDRGSTKQNKNIQECFTFDHDFQLSYA